MTLAVALDRNVGPGAPTSCSGAARQRLFKDGRELSPDDSTPPLLGPALTGLLVGSESRGASSRARNLQRVAEGRCKAGTCAQSNRRSTACLLTARSLQWNLMLEVSLHCCADYVPHANPRAESLPVTYEAASKDRIPLVVLLRAFAPRPPGRARGQFPGGRRRNGTSCAMGEPSANR